MPPNREPKLKEKKRTNDVTFPSRGLQTYDVPCLVWTCIDNKISERTSSKERVFFPFSKKVFPNSRAKKNAIQRRYLRSQNRKTKRIENKPCMGSQIHRTFSLAFWTACRRAGNALLICFTPNLEHKWTNKERMNKKKDEWGGTPKIKIPCYQHNLSFFIRRVKNRKKLKKFFGLHLMVNLDACTSKWNFSSPVQESEAESTKQTDGISNSSKIFDMSVSSTNGANKTKAEHQQEEGQENHKHTYIARVRFPIQRKWALRL
jgi:hypothetical protein